MNVGQLSLGQDGIFDANPRLGRIKPTMAKKQNMKDPSGQVGEKVTQG